MPFKPQRIRDPIHNLIEFRANEFEDALWRVLQTRPFQRLRRIKQLGFSDLVYPGATHSRFAHSIGVFHTARELMGVVREHLGEARYRDRMAETALAAALVHDVGHGPFSHAFEQVGKRLGLKLADHAVMSGVLIKEGEVAEALNSLGSGFANDVAAVVTAERPTIYGAVVSSQFLITHQSKP
jgi:HD superfamily phosphohydrolase